MGRPNLYDFTLSIFRGDERIDQIESYFGMRKISIKDKLILINDRPVFQRLVLDQGFYPEGVYTAPADEDFKKDIEISKGLGFNGARMHQKVFDPRYIYWADRMGYIVWGEFADWGLDLSEYKALGVFLPQWLEALERDFNHPSIVGWCPFNEIQKDNFVTEHEDFVLLPHQDDVNTAGSSGARIRHSSWRVGKRANRRQ